MKVLCRLYFQTFAVPKGQMTTPRSEIQSFDDFFVVSLNKLLNQQPSLRWTSMTNIDENTHTGDYCVNGDNSDHIKN